MPSRSRYGRPAVPTTTTLILCCFGAPKKADVHSTRRNWDVDARVSTVALRTPSTYTRICPQATQRSPITVNRDVSNAIVTDAPAVPDLRIVPNQRLLAAMLCHVDAYTIPE